MKDSSVNPIEAESATDSTLLRSAIANDQAAWRQLVDTYGGRVYKWARQCGLQESDAADVTNQVFLSVAKALPRLRREEEGDTFRGWLRRITQNAVQEHRRSAGRTAAAAAGGTDNLALLQNQRGPDPSTSQSSSLGRPETPEQAAVERVKAMTPEDKWRIFWLVTAEEMPPQEVAEVCHVSVQTVYLTKHRIAKRIQRELEEGA